MQSSDVAGSLPSSASVNLTPKGLAVCDFAFRDGPALGLDKTDAYRIAKELIEEWDGSKTLLEMYQERKTNER